MQCNFFKKKSDKNRATIPTFAVATVRQLYTNSNKHKIKAQLKQYFGANH